MTTTIRKGDWIQTYTGKLFWPLDPQKDEIDIEDIAHALSNICRFTGHVKDFYSVAQHSLLVSDLCQSNKLSGLLHDGSEAYICDIARPVKRLDEMRSYREVEKIVQTAIFSAFSLEYPEPREVKQADDWAVFIEANALMPHPERCWTNWDQFWEKIPQIVKDIQINPMPPKLIENRFMDKFLELYHGSKD
jgi:hypothetical protein